MKKKLKTINYPIIELSDGNPLNYNLDLLGPEELVKYDLSFAESVSNGEIDISKSKFRDHYEEGEYFYYCVQRINGDDGIDLTEIGVGTLITGGLELKRVRPMYTVDKSGKISPSYNGPYEFFKAEDTKYIVIKNHLPTNLSELLIQENSVLCSSDQEFVPVAVQLSNNTVLGRMSEGIEAISIEMLRDMTIERIKEYTKQLILKSSQLDIKKIKTQQLILKPHSSPDAKAGTLFFDEIHKELKMFTGEEWKTVAWKTEE